MRKFIEARKAAKTEGGFSLIDVVVTVAIIVALSVGGFVAYTGLVDSAKTAAVGGAADQLRTASVVAVNDSDTATTIDTVITAFNGSTTELVASRTDATGATSATGDYIKVVNKDTPAKSKIIKVA